MNGFKITPMLDEDDSTPVFEVRGESGHFVTNVANLDDAFEIIRKQMRPAPTLEQIAESWIRTHGTHTYDNISDDIREDAEVPLTEDQLDSILNMIDHAEVTVTFPFGYGVPPVIGG